MALTPEEEQELEQLKSQRIELTQGKGQAERVGRLEQPIPGRLTEQKLGILPDPGQMEIQRLRDRRAQIISQRAKEESSPDELVNQLFGIGPLDKQPKAPKRIVTGDPSFMGAGVAREQEVNFSLRNTALRKLRSKFSDEQIQNAVKISNLQRKAQTSRASDFIPTAAGALAGLAASAATGGPDPTDLATFPAVANAVKVALATSGGAGVGEVGRQKLEGETIDLIKAGKVALTEGAIDLGTAGTLRAVGKIAAPFRSTIIPEAAKFQDEFARVGKELGSDIPYRLTPQQMTRSKLIASAESLSSGEIKSVLQPKQFDKFMEFKLDEIAEGAKRLDATDLSPIIDDAIRGKEGSQTLARIQDKRNYVALDELIKKEGLQNPVIVPQEVKSVILDASGNPTTTTVMRNFTEEFPGAPIDLRPLKARIAKSVEMSAKIGGRKFGPSPTKIMTAISNSDDFVSYGLAKDLRTSILKELPELKFMRSGDVGEVSKLAQDVNNLIVGSGSKFGISEKAESLRKVVNKFHTENFGTGISGSKVGTFNKDAVKSTLKAISKDKPEDLIPLFFKKEARKTVELGREVLGDEAFDRLRSTWLDSVVKASKDGEGVLNGKSFLNRINDLGEKTLLSVFPDPKHLEDVMTIGVGSQALKRQTRTVGQIAINQAEMGAIAAIMSGATKGSPRKTLTALTFLGLPSAMTAITNSPKASRLFVQGMRLPAGSKAASSLFGRSIRAASQRDPGPILKEIEQLQARQNELVNQQR